MPDETPQYTGTWIPKHVMLDKELKMVERALYGEIASFTDCFASNAFFAERLGVSERQVQRALAKLKELGYVEDVSFDGRRRHMTANADQPRQKRHGSHDKNNTSATSNLSPIEYSKNTDKNTVSNKIATTTKKSGQELKDNFEEDTLLTKWAEIYGAKPKLLSAERRYIRSLLKHHGIERATGAIAAAHAVVNTEFAPVITSFKDLWYKWEKLEAFYNRKVRQQQQRSVTITE